MTTEMKKIRCQSCSMPLDEGFFGSDANGQLTEEYCRFCYQNGEFIEPSLSMQQMIDRTVDFMTRKLKLPEAKAREFTHVVIPKLKRWNPHSVEL